MGVNSPALQAKAEQQPYFIAAATLAVGGSLISVPGGVLVHDEQKRTIGAVGASGDTSDNDEAAAFAGLVAANLMYASGPSGRSATYRVTLRAAASIGRRPLASSQANPLDRSPSSLRWSGVRCALTCPSD
jgi:Haem-degrading